MRTTPAPGPVPEWYRAIRTPSWQRINEDLPEWGAAYPLDKFLTDDLNSEVGRFLLAAFAAGQAARLEEAIKVVEQNAVRCSEECRRVWGPYDRHAPDCQEVEWAGALADLRALGGAEGEK